MTARKIPLDAPTGPNRHLAACVLFELGGEANFAEFRDTLANRLVGAHRKQRARAAIMALYKRGNVSIDGDRVRLLVMPGRPLTPAELKERKRATAARQRAEAASRCAERIPPPDDQDDEEITLGVGRFALWTPRALIEHGELHYLLWFVGRDSFRCRHGDAWRAAAYVLGQHLLREAQR